MSPGINYNLLSIILLSFLISLIHPCHSLFEYICEEKQLFKPYVHVYRGRKGERVLETGPGFHVMTQEQDIYVCVNGPAYLYFARTTELGQVYEAPQPHVYSHTCEMYNVKPHSKATKMDYELHLMAVLLYGDPDDYRRPSIQRFTAPYYFEADEYQVGFPAHFQNATSVAIIGESECTLEKGDQYPKIPIVIHPIWPVAAVPTVMSGEKPEIDMFLCRLGFSDTLKSEAKGKDDNSEEKRMMRLMVNDEPIRVLNCIAPYAYEESEFNAKKANALRKYEDLKAKWSPGVPPATAPTIANRTQAFDDLVAAQIALYDGQIKALEDKITPTAPAKPPSQAVIDKYNKMIDTLKAKKDLETEKKTALTALVTAVDAAVTAPEALWGAIDATKANASAVASINEKEKLAKIELEVPPDQVKINAAKDDVIKADAAAYPDAKMVHEALSNAMLATDKAAVLVAELEAKMVYKVSKIPTTKKKPGIVYTARTSPEQIPIGDINCETLPRLTGINGECKKGKPDGDKACELFHVTLEKKELWTEPDDAWKKEIIDLVGGIFVNACPYLPNRRKFVKLINLLFGYYLTSDEHFNKPSTAGTSDSCRAFHSWQKDPFVKPPYPTGPVPGLDANKAQRDFWKTILEALTECKAARRSLTFVDKSPTYGRWVWVKPNENKTEVTIEPYREQAEKEYVFNWVIEMAWRIFATTLGICMPGYEEKVPLITSRFYSMFTEDFLIPLRETWVNSKDNLVFQWILGEFYNGDAENWSELCMEASYFYSEREDYRPLRSLLVNCASEHNYFITGKFVGYSGKYVGLRK